MFLKNKNIIFKIRISKVTDYAALTTQLNCYYQIWCRISKSIQILSFLDKLFLKQRRKWFINTKSKNFGSRVGDGEDGVDGHRNIQYLRGLRAGHNQNIKQMRSY